MELFWYDDVSVLFEPSKLKKYIPLNSFSKSEKLNAIVRFGFYISILLIVLTFNINYIFIAFFCLILTLLINSNEEDKKIKHNKKNVENYDNLKQDETFTKNNIKVIRPGHGISPIYFDKLINKVSPIKINKDEPLNQKILKKLKIL